MVMQNEDFGITLEIEKDNKLTQNSENPVISILKPNRLSHKKVPRLPQGCDKIFAAILETKNVEDELEQKQATEFEEEVIITLPVNLKKIIKQGAQEGKTEKEIIDKIVPQIKVLYYDEEKQTYTLDGFSGENGEIGGTAVMDDKDAQK